MHVQALVIATAVVLVQLKPKTVVLLIAILHQAIALIKAQLKVINKKLYSRIIP